jgi:hypothetical protein
MSIEMLSRRLFIRSVASGLLVAAAPVIARERGVWQVPSSAPVRRLRTFDDDASIRLTSVVAPGRTVKVSRAAWLDAITPPHRAWSTSQQLLVPYKGPLMRIRTARGMLDVYPNDGTPPAGAIRIRDVPAAHEIALLYDQSGSGNHPMSPLGHGPSIAIGS